jgi:hypothetical protein
MTQSVVGGVTTSYAYAGGSQSSVLSETQRKHHESSTEASKTPDAV